MTQHPLLISLLPGLRRFAKALIGNSAEADGAIYRTVQAISSNEEWTTDERKARFALYGRFLEELAADAPESPSDAGPVVGSTSASPPNMERQALLLTALANFTEEDTAELLGTDAKTVSALAHSGRLSLYNGGPAKILIVEDEPIIAMDLETIVRELGLDVVHVAVTYSDAIAAAQRHRPNLILADIQLADDSSGIDVVRDAQKFLNFASVFITAFPERLLTGERPEPTFLVTKPFQRSTVRAAITQALLLDTVDGDDDEGTDGGVTGLLQSDEEPTTPGAAAKALLAQDLSQRPGPVSAQVVGGRLSSRKTPPAAAGTSLANIEAARHLHLDTADRLIEEFEGHNVAAGLLGRMEAARRTLSRPFDETSGTALGIQAQGLSRLLATMRDLLMDHVAADLESFAGDLSDLAWQFPLFREFVSSAERTPGLSSEQVDALSVVSRQLEAQPDETVEPLLKQELADVRESVEQAQDKVAQLGLLRAVGNTIRAIGRAIQARVKNINTQALKTFEEETGKSLGGLLHRLVVGGGLLALSTVLPAEFGWVTMIFGLLKLAQPAK